MTVTSDGTSAEAPPVRPLSAGFEIAEISRGLPPFSSSLTDFELLRRAREEDLVLLRLPEVVLLRLLEVQQPVVLKALRRLALAGKARPLPPQEEQQRPLQGQQEPLHPK